MVTPQNTPITIPVLNNDTPSQSDDNPAMLNGITSDPSNGVVQVNDDGTIDYTPNDIITFIHPDIHLCLLNLKKMENCRMIRRQ